MISAFCILRNLPPQSTLKVSAFSSTSFIVTAFMFGFMTPFVTIFRYGLRELRVPFPKLVSSPFDTIRL